eukprot:tig00021127_g18720.t1
MTAFCGLSCLPPARGQIIRELGSPAPTQLRLLRPESGLRTTAPLKRGGRRAGFSAAEIGGAAPEAARGDSRKQFEDFEVKPRKEWDFRQRKWVYEEVKPDRRAEDNERIERERAEREAAAEAERRRQEQELERLGRLREEVYVVDDMPRRIFSTEEDSEAMRETKRFMARMEEEAKRAADTPAARYPIVGGPSSRQRRLNAKKAKQQERIEARYSKATALITAEEQAQTEEQRAALRAQSEREYAMIKVELLRNCLVLGVGGTVLAYAITGDQYSTASFAAGAAGSLGYLVLLARSVDRAGPGGGGAVGYAIPVLLALLAKKYDFLEFFPSLLGFFTYKAAVLIYTFKEAFAASEPPPPPRD